MKTNLLLILLLFMMPSFQIKKKNKQVILNITRDTISLHDKPQTISGYITVTNQDGSKIRLPKEISCGYKGDLSNDYYLKILDEEKKNIEYFEKIHYVETLNPGPYFTLGLGKNYKYPLENTFYQFTKPGKYYLQIVFTNDFSTLGASNYDSIVVR